MIESQHTLPKLLQLPAAFKAIISYFCQKIDEVWRRPILPKLPADCLQLELQRIHSQYGVAGDTLTQLLGQGLGGLGGVGVGQGPLGSPGGGWGQGGRRGTLEGQVLGHLSIISASPSHRRY